MRIAFVDNIPWDYTVATPDERPLGGSQSALCHLARALAERGHGVSLFNHTTTPGVFYQVDCQSLEPWSHALSSMEVIVVNQSPNPELYEALRARAPLARIVLWLHLDVEQPAMAGVADPAIRDLWDGYVFVSDWQAKRFIMHFEVPPSRIFVGRNAVAPCFQGLFPDQAKVLTGKGPAHAPVLCFTSAPYRGLDVVIIAFLHIQRQFPQARLRVYSGMKLYQEEGEDPYQGLYDLCRRSPGIDYVGPLAQGELALALKEAALLLYPATMAETSCINVMEGLAAGCLVVGNDLGALAETGAGFAFLGTPVADRSEHGRQFAQRVMAVLRGIQADGPGWQERVRQQLSWVAQELSWQRRAGQWEGWLERLAGLPARGMGLPP